jgi:hypothetical protein
MTDAGRMRVGELVAKVLADEHADVLRQAVVWLAQELMEAEASERAGAGYGERSPERAARRNGYRQRAWDTRVGSIELAVPKLCSYFPSFLGAAPPQRAGPGRGRPGGLCQWRLHPKGRPAGRGPGAGRGVQGPGVAALPRVGRAGAGLLGAALGGRLPVPVVGRQGGEGPGRRPGRAPGPGGRLRRGASGQREVIGLDVGRPRPRRAGGSSCAAWSATASQVSSS